MKIFTPVIAALIAVGGTFAAEPLSPEELQAKMEAMKAEWETKVQDELANLPEDIQIAIADAKAKAEEFKADVDALKGSLGADFDPEELKAKIEELRTQAKADAGAKIDDALSRIEAFKTANGAEIEKLKAEMETRIAEKKAELEAKRAEIKALIEELKAKIQ